MAYSDVHQWNKWYIAAYDPLTGQLRWQKHFDEVVFSWRLKSCGELVYAATYAAAGNF